MKTPTFLSDDGHQKTDNGWSFQVFSFLGKLMDWDPSYQALSAMRKRGWFLENLSLGKLGNMLLSALQFVLRIEKTYSWPVVVKIDISPLCNLSCTVCIHADPNGKEALQKQSFRKDQRMTLEQYRRIIDEIKGRSAAVSLYYLGDPLIHPDLDAMCTIARQAGLNVHISSNFSFALSDERLKRMVQSGLTHLTVCVDGLSQEKYQLTRVGGRLDHVLSNLKRVCQYRKESCQTYPKIEVQFLKFQHNVDDLPAARRLFEEFGVDEVTDYWGQLHNYTDQDPGTFAVYVPRKNRRLPQCVWPHFFMVIKYNGDVVPCCYHRLGQQYSDDKEARVVGNVFKTSVWEVWNSPAYRELRRAVSSPERMSSEPEMKKCFCYGCPALFETDVSGTERMADKYNFEELYTIGETGRPIRRTQV